MTEQEIQQPWDQRRVSQRDLRTGEELLASGWKPLKPGSELLAEPGVTGGRGQPARRVIHIRGLAP